MSSLYPDNIFVERFLASVSASTLAQPFVAPIDLDVVGLVSRVGTAPGGSSTVIVNISCYPTSQQGGLGTTVGAYNLWSAATAPTVTGTAVNSFSISNSTTVVENVPYALNYPLPGASGATGYATAQSQSTTTQTPVVTPPIQYAYGLSATALVAPAATFTDYNGQTQPTSVVHAGDVLSFVVSGTIGSAANLAVVLLVQKH